MGLAHQSRYQDAADRPKRPDKVLATMSEIILADLSKPFPREAIHWRAQNLTQSGDKALALAYLDARDVMDRLDEVCGPANWQSRYTETARGRVLCEIGIRIDGEWVWKSDGAGDTAVEGEKGGISDALKRAAVQWGIGRYLYRLDAVWAPCESVEKGGKRYWKAWKGSPWDSVRGAQRQPQQPASPAPAKPTAPPAKPAPITRTPSGQPAQKGPDVAAMISDIESAMTGQELLGVLNKIGVNNSIPEVAQARIDRIVTLVKGAQNIAVIDAFAKSFAPDWSHVEADANARKAELEMPAALGDDIPEHLK